MSIRLVAAAITLLLGGGRGAFAHAILMESSPPIGGHVHAGALPVMLRYNSLVDVKRSRLVLVGPDRQERRVPVVADPRGDRMTARVVVAPGTNLLRWQVLAVDGHITRGNVAFDAIQ